MERDTLSLTEPKSSRVVVRIQAVSLNYRDLLVLQNASGDTRDGLVPASDAAGIVEAVGPGVTRWKIGDRVSPMFFANWLSGPFKSRHLTSALGGGSIDGVLCERITTDENALIGVAAHLSMAEAATLPCAAVTAWHALFARGNLLADQTVLIQGTGGVAVFALQLAKARGARPIVISSSDVKLERAKSLGAWRTINYRSEPNWEVAVLKLTEGEGVDHVLELGGPETFDRSVAAIASGGSIAQIGVLTGFGPRPNLLPLQFKNATIHGICVGSGEHFADLNRFLEQQNVRPIIDKTFDYSEAAAAFGSLKAAQHFGKIVITLPTSGND
ncbi:MAG: zinc-dependent alcohol dehydrogenase family protein [Hyphomicrobiaceae bacterium]